MKNILLILLIVLSRFLFSQNIVPNSSFESYSTCPSASGQLTLSINWSNPTQWGSPDYFNSCSSSVGVPKSGLGFQYPHSGNAFIGVWCYSSQVTNTREYIQTVFSNTLIANNIYLFKYFINLSNFSGLAINSVNGYVSQNQPYLTGSNSLFVLNPQIYKFDQNPINDTLNWGIIQTLYVAAGGENYLTIGNFNSDNGTYTVNVNSSSSYGAYYNIVDVSVTNIITPQWQYRDTTVYSGDSVLIGPAITGLNVNWYDMSSTFIKNAPGIYVKPTVNTSYEASETFNSAVYNHTVNVTVLAPLKVTEYEKLQNSIRLFPNPSNGNINIQFEDLKKGNIDITISDIAGKIVYQNKLQVANTLTSFDIDVKGGLYFMKIYDSNMQQTFIKKLMIQK